MNAQDAIKKFLEGEIDIRDFRKMYDEDEAINDFLQGIIDDIRAKNGNIEPYSFEGIYQDGAKLHSDEGISYLLKPESDPSLQFCPPRYTSVRQLLNYEFRGFTHDVRGACGASTFYNEVLVIYYQYDRTVKAIDRYANEFAFSLNVIPEYLCGGESEAYIFQHIIPQYPQSMKKSERIKAIKSKIREEFKSEKGHPSWIQQSEWPIGKDGKPTTYIGKGKKPNSEAACWIFRDETDGELINVIQYY